MTQVCTIVIAAPDLLPALKERSGASNGEVLTYSDREPLRALEEIVRRRPNAVELERQFALTPRGAALINRIKADPTLAQSELRVVSHDSSYARVVHRPAANVPAANTNTPTVAILEAPVEAAPPAVLDQRGTRRGLRFKIAGDVSVLLDGNSARLVDLSVVGAQVVSPTIVKPGQRVRMALVDDHGTLRFNATMAWVSFEIPPKGGPQYRAGVNFVDANGDAVGAFCLRHKA
jgi:hypothetical protein